MQLVALDGVNGTAKRVRKARGTKGSSIPTAASTQAAATPDAAVPAADAAKRVKRWLSVGMGCGIPCLSLSLSSIGGELCVEGHTGLGVASLGLCCSVLAVSLSHLAWAIRDITGSRMWQAWCLAAAVDLSLVLGELSRIGGYGSWLVPCVMGAVTVCSAVLNCWAFCRDR